MHKQEPYKSFIFKFILTYEAIEQFDHQVDLTILCYMIYRWRL